MPYGCSSRPTKRSPNFHSERQEKMIRYQQLVKAAEKVEQKLTAEATALQEIQAKSEYKALELLRKREQARIKELEVRAERERVEKEFERRRKAEERKRKEAKAQAKWRKIGICPAGFQWIKQSSGYRRSARAHWVDDAQLGL
ncbi:uncharacterized protein PAC_09797 [Phialocephala subalpina]|uniref:Uncharacterized protein n=1 Tax=Phialocephala subalpina TaxID=576137 RepID=A0A1L7X4G2_9HELO|nr:uncharacterized protein PAC_09797 [Phialocephala subalpina]